MTLLAQTSINRWWEKKRFFAASIFNLAAALYSLGLSPIVIDFAQQLIGWRDTMLIFGILPLFVSSTLGWIFLRDYPEKYGLLPDGKVLPGWQDRKRRISNAAAHRQRSLSFGDGASEDSDAESVELLSGAETGPLDGQEEDRSRNSSNRERDGLVEELDERPAHTSEQARQSKRTEGMTGWTRLQAMTSYNFWVLCLGGFFYAVINAGIFLHVKNIASTNGLEGSTSLEARK